MKFRNQEHYDNYVNLLNKMTSKDSYHNVAAYLLTLDTVLNKHINDIYDFKQGTIRSDLFKEGWQTGTSIQTYRFLLNLWSGWIYNDTKAKMSETSRYYVPSEFFDGEYARYYIEALKIRYSHIAFCSSEEVEY